MTLGHKFIQKISKLGLQSEFLHPMEVVWFGLCPERQKLFVIWKTSQKFVTKRGGLNVCTCTTYWDTNWWNYPYLMLENKLGQKIPTFWLWMVMSIFNPKLWPGIKPFLISEINIVNLDFGAKAQGQSLCTDAFWRHSKTTYIDKMRAFKCNISLKRVENLFQEC